MMASRTEKFIKNSMSTGLLQVLTLLVGLVTSRIMLSQYGSEINGLVSSINQFINYIKLVEVGLASAAVYALYAPLAHKDYEEVGLIVSSANRYYNQAGFIFTFFVVILAFIYPFSTEVTVLSYLETVTLVLVLGISGAISFFITAKYRALYTADQKQYILSYASILSVLLNMTVIIIFGQVFTINVILLKLICTLAVLLPAIVYSIYFRKHYNQVRVTNRADRRIGQRWIVFVNEIFGTIHFGSPIAIITVFCNLLEVSVFSVYRLVFHGINSLCNSLIIPMSASFGETLTQKTKTSFQRGYTEFEMAYYGMSTFVYGCAYILILPFVSVYTRGVVDVNYLRWDLALWFLVDSFTNSMYGPQAVVVRAGGYFREVRNQTILQACVTIVLGIPFTISWGLIGILIASSVANILRVVLMLKLLHQKQIGIDIQTTVKRILASSLVLVVLVAILGNVLKIEVVNYLEWGLWAIPIALIVCGMIVGVYYIFDKRTLSNLANRLKSVFIK